MPRNENAQSDNLANAIANAGAPQQPGVQSTASPETGDSFFEQLDKMVNPSFFSDEEPPGESGEYIQSSDAPTSSSSSTQKTSPPEESENPAESDEPGEGGIDYEKRYSDSTREARRLLKERKRLEDELNQVQPYMPILEAMQSDPRLVAHVRDYFERGGETPYDIKADLNLPDDFVFDMEEAISNPQSPSATIFNRAVKQVAERRATELFETEKEQRAREQQSQAQEQMAQQFRESKGLSEDEFFQLEEFAKEHTLTWDDIYTLKNLKQRDKKIAQTTQQKTLDEVKKGQKRQGSLGGKNSQGVGEKSEIDELFDVIAGASGGTDLFR